MTETGESIRPPTRSAEIKPNVSVVEWLKDAERKGSTEKFRDRVRGKDADSIKAASGMAVDKVGELLQNNEVVDEMLKLGISVNLGKFSVSARPEDDEEVIKFWKKGKPWNRVAPVITAKVGPEEFSQKGSVSRYVYRPELEKMLKKPESTKDVWAVVESLGNLTPRDIARAFRKSIEDGQHAVENAQKHKVKEELRVLRGGN